MEQWLPVVGYEGYYEVSNEGRVRRLHSPTNKAKSGFLAPGRAPNGYLRVVLSRHNHQKNASVHRLVVEAFIGPFEHREQTNHRDGNKGNNRLGNLEKVSGSENMRHATKMGLNTASPPHLQGSRHHQAKLSEEIVKVIRISTESNRALARHYGVDRRTISFIRQRKTWSHI